MIARRLSNQPTSTVPRLLNFNERGWAGAPPSLSSMANLLVKPDHLHKGKMNHLAYNLEYPLLYFWSSSSVCRIQTPRNKTSLMKFSERLDFSNPAADIDLKVEGHRPYLILDRGAVSPDKSSIQFSFKGQVNTNLVSRAPMSPALSSNIQTETVF